MASRPAIRPLLDVYSPPLRAVPPEVVHPERIPPDMFDAMSATRTAEFPGRTIRVHLLADAFVACEGLVFDRHGVLFPPTRVGHAPPAVAWATEQVAAALSGADPASCFDETLILAKQAGAANYGHWLVEMFSRLAFCFERFGAAPVGALLHDVSDPAIGGVIRDTVLRLGILPDRVRVSNSHPVRVRRLLVVEGLTEHGTYLSPLVAPLLRRLAGQGRGLGAGKVFLSRRDHLSRDFSDPDRAALVAERCGYRVLQPGAMAFEAQVDALRDARVIAGVMGAALTNVVFAAPPARLLAFAPSAMPDTFYWFLCQVFGHRYREVRCMAGEHAGAGAPYDRPLLIDDDELRRHLDAA